MATRTKRIALVLVTFLIVLGITVYGFVQIVFQLTDMKEPLKKAAITERDLTLDIFGGRISEEKQKRFEQVSGDTFYSDSRIEDLATYWLLILVPTFAITTIVVTTTNYFVRRRRTRIREREEARLRNEYYRKYPLPQTCYKVTCTDSLNRSSDLVQPLLYLWFEDNSIHIVNSDYHRDIGKIIISYDSIVCFSRYGDFFTSTRVYEESPSFGRFVAGSLIGGGVGAIVASRGSIASQTKVHDHRETILVLSEDGQESYLFFDPNLFQILMHRMPNKEITYLSKSLKESKGSDVVEKLKTLGELQEKGHISKEEFDRLKSELLKSS